MRAGIYITADEVSFVKSMWEAEFPETAMVLEWLKLLAESRTALFVSIAENMYNDAVKADIKKAFSIAAQRAEGIFPSGVCASPTPCGWEDAQGNVISFKWKK